MSSVKPQIKCHNMLYNSSYLLYTYILPTCQVHVGELITCDELLLTVHYLYRLALVRLLVAGLSNISNKLLGLPGMLYTVYLSHCAPGDKHMARYVQVCTGTQVG